MTKRLENVTAHSRTELKARLVEFQTGEDPGLSFAEVFSEPLLP